MISLNILRQTWHCWDFYFIQPMLDGGGVVVVVDNVALQTRLLLLRPTVQTTTARREEEGVQKYVKRSSTITTLKQLEIGQYFIKKNINFSNYHILSLVLSAQSSSLRCYLTLHCVARVSQWDSQDRPSRTIWQLTKVTRVILIGTIQSQEQGGKQHKAHLDNIFWLISH